MLLYSLLQGNYNYMSFVDTTTAVQQESLARPIVHEVTGCVHVSGRLVNKVLLSDKISARKQQ